jgi:hypothetical protein
MNQGDSFIPGKELKALAKEVKFGSVTLKIQDGKLVLIKFEKTLTVSEN